MDTIADNIRRVQERIAVAADRCGRDPADITLVVVSKTVSAERIREAVEAGIRDFGENYYQEAREKLDLLPADLHWHFIGHLQTNKAKYIVGRFALVQSVDRIELAQELSRRAESRNIVQPVLIEVKLDPTESKTGILPDEALGLAEEIAKLRGLRLKGMMGIPPLAGGAEAARPYFAQLRALFEHLPEEYRRTLSMGMTADFEVAIEEGANLVRVGTAIFGKRDA
jgi:pyridoxal phosphate enzyme (YggS family)